MSIKLRIKERERKSKIINAMLLSIFHSVSEQQINKQQEASGGVNRNANKVFLSVRKSFSFSLFSLFSYPFIKH